MQGQLWIEVVGELFLVRDARRGKVLYDTLEMQPAVAWLTDSPPAAGFHGQR
jgi:hypothetical protein